MSSDQSEDNAQYDGCDRRLDGLIHRSRCSNLHTVETIVRSFALKPSGNGSRPRAPRLCYIKIEPGSTRENGYYERFNACCRNEFLNGEIFCIVRRSNRDEAVETALHYETAVFSHRIQTNRSRKLHSHVGKVTVARRYKSDQTLGLAIALVRCWHCPTSTYTGGIALLLSLPACVVSLPPLIARYL